MSRESFGQGQRSKVQGTEILFHHKPFPPLQVKLAISALLPGCTKYLITQTWYLPKYCHPAGTPIDSLEGLSTCIQCHRQELPADLHQRCLPGAPAANCRLSHMWESCLSVTYVYLFFKTDDLNQVYIIVLKLRTIFNSHENPTCWLLNEGTGHKALTRDRLIFPFLWAYSVV